MIRENTGFENTISVIISKQRQSFIDRYTTASSYLVEGSVSRSEDGEGSGPGEVLHHAGGLQGGVEGGEVLVLGDHGSNALPGLVDGHRGLGGGAGDGVDVRSAEVVRLGTRRTDGEVVVKSPHQPGLVGASLASQERVESLWRRVSWFGVRS